ncbi:hypothetical protein BGW80DRAFT_1348931 [Lactifluus volemus]|nr:hypothetical protein BGW80DRAFT_1348931 [Lactifluus volemus]
MLSLSPPTCTFSHKIKHLGFSNVYFALYSITIPSIKLNNYLFLALLCLSIATTSAIEKMKLRKLFFKVKKLKEVKI